MHSRPPRTRETEIHIGVSDIFASDRLLIDIDPMNFAIWVWYSAKINLAVTNLYVYCHS